MTPYLLISGDFVRTGGMDAANYWMARCMAERGCEVHLVAHRVAHDLASLPTVRVHRVPKPLRSYFLGEPLLDRTGRYWACILKRRGGKVLANGGNCASRGSNWVHYVHAAYEPSVTGGPARRVRRDLTHRLFLANERRALMRSTLIIANSVRTAADVTERFPAAAQRVRTVYYGIDAEQFRPPDSDDRKRSRSSLGLPADVPVVLFAGSVADERKGFSSLYASWKRLCGDDSWNAHLAVAGGGSDVADWRARASDDGIADRVHFLDFRSDMPQVLKACDAFVSPTRYEAYGLAVHEAVCTGLPAFVTATAGVAERYPASLRHLLLREGGDVQELSGRLHHWRLRMEEYRAAVAAFSSALRSRTWAQTCSEMAGLIEAAG